MDLYPYFEFTFYNGKPMGRYQMQKLLKKHTHTKFESNKREYVKKPDFYEKR